MVNWKDESALKCLTEAIMVAHFGLRSYRLPKDYLIPRIPQREAYLEWLHTLFAQTEETNEKLKGFDIGVGANCVYPILGLLKYGW